MISGKASWPLRLAARAVLLFWATAASQAWSAEKFADNFQKGRSAPNGWTLSGGDGQWVRRDLLEVTGAVSTKIAFLGSLTVTVNFSIFIGPRTGIVGRVFLALASNDIPGININGVFLLEINTFTAVDAPERTIETFKIKELKNLRCRKNCIL